MNETLTMATHYVAAQETSCPEFFTTWALTAVPATLATCIRGACIIQAKSNRSGSLKASGNFGLTWKSLIQTSLWAWDKLHWASFVPGPKLRGFEGRCFTARPLGQALSASLRSTHVTCCQPTNCFLYSSLTLKELWKSHAHQVLFSLNVKSTSTLELTHSSNSWTDGLADNDAASTLRVGSLLTVLIVQSKLIQSDASISVGDALVWQDERLVHSQSRGVVSVIQKRPKRSRLLPD
jgi:hypothetical protein